MFGLSEQEKRPRRVTENDGYRWKERYLGVERSRCFFKNSSSF